MSKYLGLVVVSIAFRGRERNVRLGLVRLTKARGPSAAARQARGLELQLGRLGGRAPRLGRLGGRKMPRNRIFQNFFGD